MHIYIYITYTFYLFNRDYFNMYFFFKCKYCNKNLIPFKFYYLNLKFWYHWLIIYFINSYEFFNKCAKTFKNGRKKNILENIHIKNYNIIINKHDLYLYLYIYWNQIIFLNCDIVPCVYIIMKFDITYCIFEIHKRN